MTNQERVRAAIELSRALDDLIASKDHVACAVAELTNGSDEAEELQVDLRAAYSEMSHRCDFLMSKLADLQRELEAETA